MQVRGDLGALAHGEPLGAFPVAVADQAHDERAGHQGGPTEDDRDRTDGGGQGRQSDLPGDEHHRGQTEQGDPGAAAHQPPVRLLLRAVRRPPDEGRATGGGGQGQGRAGAHGQGDPSGGEQTCGEHRPGGAGWGGRVGLGGGGQQPQQQVGDQPDPAGQRGNGERGTHRSDRDLQVFGHAGAHAGEQSPVRSPLQSHPAIVPAAWACPECWCRDLRVFSGFVPDTGTRGVG